MKSAPLLLSATHVRANSSLDDVSHTSNSCRFRREQVGKHTHAPHSLHFSTPLHWPSAPLSPVLRAAQMTAGVASSSSALDFTPHRTRGKVHPSFGFGVTTDDDAEGADKSTLLGPIAALEATTATHVDRERRQSTTVQCTFTYGMTGYGGCTQDTCVMNIPNTWFTNLRYGVDQVALSCGLPAAEVGIPVPPSPPPLCLTRPPCCLSSSRVISRRMCL